VPRCGATTERLAVRGQTDPKTGKPLKVTVKCQGALGHPGAHFNGSGPGVFSWREAE